MSSLFSSAETDWVSSPRLSVRAWRWMVLPAAETVPAGAADLCTGRLCTAVGGGPGERSGSSGL